MTQPVRTTGITTFRGRPVTLLGQHRVSGMPAPEFTVLRPDFAPVTLADSAGQVRVLSTVPSLDTEVCDLQARRFHEACAGLPGVVAMTVSVDLPFAQRRWCGSDPTAAVTTLSDHRDLSLGIAYGVAIEEFRLLARAVFVIDAADRLSHVEYVTEVGDHPDYDAAVLAAARVR